MSNDLLSQVLELPLAERIELRTLLEASLATDGFDASEGILDDEFEDEIRVRQRSIEDGTCRGFDAEETLRQARELCGRNAP